MGRSGKLLATRDSYIERLVFDNRYQIRDDGTIWTKVSKQGHCNLKQWRQCSIFENHSGHLKIKYDNQSLALHRIIYRKFHGVLSPDLVVNHIDGDPKNNRPINLELVTQSQNNIHRFRTLGHAPVTGARKLSLEQVHALRHLRECGASYKELMVKFDLSKSTVSYIVNKKTYTKK